ncbi:hypothetical protein AXF42_Ash020994 [Apostasia shenzhenica]|uniref:Uncharacterized protein n=1 Tax=Apostasia shenzhenica TaxID=1088818 RepID=A0A2I0AEY4_9ASPA|nr:hypothetical protein AXF42_Ash020994 [Apostasia shenzhenica]
MGNCMERSVRQCWGAAEEEKGEGGVGKEEKKEEEEEEEKSGRKKKVRIVVTRAELEWLMEQLGEKQGGRRLEDLLQEMAEIMEFRKEDQVRRWRPELGSIMEVPETQSFESSAVLPAVVLPAVPEMVP